MHPVEAVGVTSVSAGADSGGRWWTGQFQGFAGSGIEGRGKVHEGVMSVWLGRRLNLFRSCTDSCRVEPRGSVSRTCTLTDERTARSPSMSVALNPFRCAGSGVVANVASQATTVTPAAWLPLSYKTAAEYDADEPTDCAPAAAMQLDHG